MKSAKLPLTRSIRLPFGAKKQFLEPVNGIKRYLVFYLKCLDFSPYYAQRKSQAEHHLIRTHKGAMGAPVGHPSASVCLLVTPGSY
jgi:hypothetical protein